MKHPYVSEDHEGKPWFEWLVAALITGLVRLVLRERSPWKVRSVVFDAFIGIALGIGLLVLLILFPVGM